MPDPYDTIMIGAGQKDLTPNLSTKGCGNVLLEWNSVCALRNHA